MDAKEILKFCVEKGLLLDPEVLGLFSETADEDKTNNRENQKPHK